MEEYDEEEEEEFEGEDQEDEQEEELDEVRGDDHGGSEQENELLSGL